MDNKCKIRSNKYFTRTLLSYVCVCEFFFFFLPQLANDRVFVQNSVIVYTIKLDQCLRAILSLFCCLQSPHASLNMSYFFTEKNLLG